jgi:hypothetical protein
MHLAMPLLNKKVQKLAPNLRTGKHGGNSILNEANILNH